MKTTLYWKKELFTGTCKIYSEDNLVGYLNEKSWSQYAEAELNGEKFIFKTKGFFNRETQIYKIENETPVGKITYNTWRRKARIEYSGKVYSWSFINLFSTKWIVQNDEGFLINYRSSCSKGSIESDHQNNLLTLTGIFIRNYYSQNSVAIVTSVFFLFCIVIFNV
jgi:hypothetical protein